MRLGCCLVACDLNRAYLEFFPLVYRLWRELVGIDVRFVLIADAVPASLAKFDGSVDLFRPLPDVHTAFQAQCVRLLYPALLGKDYGDAIVTSDIDMLPMNRRYFVSPIARVKPDSFVVYRSGILDDVEEVRICYNAAAPATWAELFGGIRDDGDVRGALQDWWAELDGYQGVRHGTNWNTDQRTLFKRLKVWDGAAGEGRVVRLSDRATGFRRLDRIRPKQLLKAFSRGALQIRRRRSSDFHMMQPPLEYAALNAAAAAAALAGPSTWIDCFRAAVGTRVS